MAKILAESAFSCLLLLTSITAYCYSANRRSKRLQNMEHCLEPMTEEEMYALEFSPEELCEEPSAEEPETEYHCPVCHATELQYAMHYRVSDDDETQELYQCARCGATGEADDCRVESAPIHESADSVFEHPFPILGPGDHHRVQSGVRIEHTASPDAATTSQKANGK